MFLTFFFSIIFPPVTFFLLLKKIHPSQFEDLIGFIKQFKNRTASPLANTDASQRATERKKFLKIGQGNHKQKKGLFQVRSPLFGDKCSYWVA